MSFYYEHQWARINFASGRKIVIFITECDERTFKGNGYDLELAGRGKMLRVVQRSQIETLDIVTESEAREHMLANQLKPKGRKPESSAEPKG